MKIDELLENQLTQIEKIDSMFGPGVADDLLRQKGTSVLFAKDNSGRNWKIIKSDDGEISLERDYMLEGDVLMIEGKTKALVGTIVSLKDDVVIIEGSMHPLDESEIKEGIGKWAGTAALIGLLGLGAGQMLDSDSPERTPLGRAMAAAAAKGDDYAARELKNLRIYIEAGDYDKLAQLNDTYLHVPTASDPAVKESVHNFTVDDIKQLERLNGLEDVKRQAISLVSTPSKRPISPEKQAWLKNEINGKKDKMAVIKLMYDLMLGGEGMKVIGSKSKYRRRFDEETVGDRRSFTVTMKFEDGSKATRVFLAKGRDEALEKAKAWAKKEQGEPKDIKIVAEGWKSKDHLSPSVVNAHSRRMATIYSHDPGKPETVYNLNKDGYVANRARQELYLQKNIMVQLTNNLNLNTAKPLVFKDGSNFDIDQKTAKLALKKIAGLKAAEKHAVVNDISSSKDVFLDFMKNTLAEAEYHGREVKLGKPMAGDVKKYKVYVKDPKTGNIKKVNFGDKGMEIKRDNPDRRRNFRKRHGCGTPRASDRTKAAYWSCRMWSSKPVSKILKGK